MCHAIGGAGAEVGPALDGWGRGKSAEVIATAIVQPDAGIAQGYDGHRDPDEGRADDPGAADQGGRPADDAQHGRPHADHSRGARGHAQRLPQSLMMSAAQLGLTAQDVADLVAFLRSH